MPYRKEEEIKSMWSGEVLRGSDCGHRDRVCGVDGGVSRAVDQEPG